MSLYGIVAHFSDRVNDGRQNQDIFKHALGEMEELREELITADIEGEPGPDGILGEAVDVIACMMDIIRKNYPNIGDDQLEKLMTEKCTKRERKTYAGEYTNR